MKKLNYAVLLLISLYALATLTLVLINNATAAKASITIEKGSSSPKAKQMYSPASLTIKKGTTVTWTNDDITLHTVTSGSPDLGDSGAEFDSSYLAAGKSFDFRFEKNGKFDYYCTLHPFMKGIIQVTALGKNPILSNQKNQTAPLTSIQDKGSFLIRMTPLVEGYLYPSSNVTINKGTTVIWKNIFDSEVYIKSSADLDHYEGEVLDSGLLQAGETFSYKFNEKGSFPYTGSNGIEGVVNVVDGNNSINANIQKKNLQINASANNLNINQIKWINFTDDQSLFSVEYPSQWTAKAGNRFTDDPPLMVENMNGNQTIAHSKFEVMIFGNENLSSLKWAQLKKRELVDSIKDTKLVEPIRCEGYNIDGVQACGFVFAANNDAGKRVGILVLIVNDNANMTHLIRYTADPVIFDPEQPILNHMLMSYKLNKNHKMTNELNDERINTISNESMTKLPDLNIIGNKTSLNLTGSTFNSTLNQKEANKNFTES